MIEVAGSTCEAGLYEISGPNLILHADSTSSTIAVCKIELELKLVNAADSSLVHQVFPSTVYVQLKEPCNTMTSCTFQNPISYILGSPSWSYASTCEVRNEDDGIEYTSLCLFSATSNPVAAGNTPPAYDPNVVHFDLKTAKFVFNEIVGVASALEAVTFDLVMAKKLGGLNDPPSDTVVQTVTANIEVIHPCQTSQIVTTLAA